jgi:hypothetical protein
MLMTANRMEESTRRFRVTLERYGYRPDLPSRLSLVNVDSVDEVQRISDMVLASESCSDSDSLDYLITVLIGEPGDRAKLTEGHVSPAFYLGDLDDTAELFRLSMSLLAKLGCAIEVNAGIIALGMITVRTHVGPS